MYLPARGCEVAPPGLSVTAVSQSCGSSAALGTATHGAGSALPPRSCGTKQLQTPTSLLRQDQAWPCRAAVGKRKAAHGEDIAWHRSERQPLIHSGFGRGGCSAALKGLLAPGWRGPRSDLVPGRGWQSSVLSSQRLQTRPASQQPQEHKNPAGWRLIQSVLTFLPYADVVQNAAGFRVFERARSCRKVEELK